MEEDDESKGFYGSPLLSPRSNKVSENITYRSIGVLSKNISNRDTSNYDKKDPVKDSFNSKFVGGGRNGSSSKQQDLNQPLLTSNEDRFNSSSGKDSLMSNHQS